ncbi:MAG: VWA domain-containing protein, partial [Neisseriaceae bacterium]|nr:VWA domain-containing protein [Neisseriaceae bacterium]
MTTTVRSLTLAFIAIGLGACSQPAPLVALSSPEPMSTLKPPSALSGRVSPMVKQRVNNAIETRTPVANTAQYGEIKTNPVHMVAQEPVSTFSIDVDTGSYSNTRRFLTDGRLPPSDAVRTEEMINYFPYDYAYQKAQNAPFSVFTEVVDSPWKSDAKIMAIGIKADDMKMSDLPPANLVFLIDISGSMSGEKLALTKTTLKILTEQLRPQDKVSIITYASGEELVLPATPGANKQKILQVIDRLQAQGATAGEQAIQMAYKEAEKHYIKGGINRIMLATDGDFNVGITDFATLKAMVAEKRQSGIALSTLGYGVNNYNERLMEQLADAGSGNYSYIDSKQEANKVVKHQLSATLTRVASDVKLQVEFNPELVQEYRLIGYENRLLAAEDFNNDKVDAGEIGAGHTVTALYELTLVGKPGWHDAPRYAPKSPNSAPLGHEYAFLKVRYKP